MTPLCVWGTSVCVDDTSVCVGHQFGVPWDLYLLQSCSPGVQEVLVCTGMGQDATGHTQTWPHLRAMSQN